MRTALECIPCLARQALEAGRFVTDDPYVHERLLRHVLRLTAEMDLAQCPPVVAREIHQALRQMTEKYGDVTDGLDLAAKADDLGYTEREIITIASIIQAEARLPEDFPKVARVIYNLSLIHI